MGRTGDGKTGSCSGVQGFAELSFNPIICWWVGLYSFLSSCLAWSDPALGSTGCMIGLMVNSKRVYAKGDLPVPPSLWWAIPAHVSTGSPLTLAGSFGSVSCGVTPLVWALVHAKFCLCLSRLESLFPSVLWKAYNQILLAIKARFPRDSQSLCIIPRLGSLTWDSKLWQ